tara:strand:- start:112 stop:372 length:261 start_codon:yes stop_codon:yes gene_type:complete
VVVVELKVAVLQMELQVDLVVVLVLLQVVVVQVVLEILLLLVLLKVLLEVMVHQEQETLEVVAVVLMRLDKTEVIHQELVVLVEQE